MTASAQDLIKPWQRSWFYCAPGEVVTLSWILGLHLVVIVGLATLPAPPFGAVMLAGAAAFVGGLGTTVCYHRALAHRSLRLHPIIEQALICAAMLNGSGKPATWVAMHRLHHATSDREDDISSPHQGGFWWAHLRWLWQAEQARSMHLVPDLQDRRYHFWSRAQIPILAVSAFGGLLWPGEHLVDVLAAALWIGPIRLLYSLHVQCSVNSICHLGSMSSQRGSSRNVSWLTLFHLGQGENWHANHHGRPADARLGRGWQVDLGWWMVRLLQLCGLVKHVRSSSPAT